MKRLLLFLIMMVVVGCTGFSAQQKVAVACESAASALDTLAAGKMAGKVSNEQLLEAVGIYETAVVPVCVPVAANVSQLKQAALKAAVADLVARAGGVK